MAVKPSGLADDVLDVDVIEIGSFNSDLDMYTQFHATTYNHNCAIQRARVLTQARKVYRLIVTTYQASGNITSSL